MRNDRTIEKTYMGEGRREWNRGNIHLQDWKRQTNGIHCWLFQPFTVLAGCDTGEADCACMW